MAQKLEYNKDKEKKKENYFLIVQTQTNQLFKLTDIKFGCNVA